MTPLLKENEDLALSGKVTKESIDFLTSKIRALENTVEYKVRLKDPYKNC